MPRQPPSTAACTRLPRMCGGAPSSLVRIVTARATGSGRPARLAPSQHPGDPGESRWQTFEAGDIRTRIVEYSPGYVADHWCERGHVVFVLEGELVTELRDGRSFTLGPGQGYVVSDADGAHRSVSPRGARLFIVD